MSSPTVTRETIIGLIAHWKPQMTVEVKVSVLVGIVALLDRAEAEVERLRGDVERLRGESTQE